MKSSQLLLSLVLFGLLCVALSAKKFDSRTLVDYAKTPGGYIHKSCVHNVGNGAEITRNSDDTITVVRPDGIRHRILPCSYPHYPVGVDGNGWQVFAYYDAGTTLSSYNGSWNVPDIPSKYANQLLYTFTGLQNSFSLSKSAPAGVDIIQPVLQFGPGPAGGGAFWGFASWYVTSTGVALHSNYVDVNPSDTILGTMNKGPDGTKWNINAYDQNTQQNSTLIMGEKLGRMEPFAFVTLEVYDVTDCTQYPKSPLQYVDLAIELCDQTGCKTTQPAWQTESQQVICNEAVTVNGADSVTISF